MVFLKTFSLGLLFLAVMFGTWWAAESASVFVPSFSASEPDFDRPKNAPALSAAQAALRADARQSSAEALARSALPRVGIQVGHLKNDEVPEELQALSKSGPGAVAAGTTERAVVLKIAQRTKLLLQREGVEVDLLPATVPPAYRAHAFVSLHADASASARVRGFKIAGPAEDASGQSAALVAALYDSYEKATGMPREHSVTERMRWYYAFNWQAYEHAVHPLTPAAIIETGYLTNVQDRAILTEGVDRAARGVAAGVLEFLRAHPAP